MSPARAADPRLIYLYPGELVVARAPAQVSTVVGSCVAVFLWDARRGVGGMNHYILPSEPRPDAPSPRFGTTAVAQLVERLGSEGSEPASLVAKVFGGAHVIAGAPVSAIHLGDQNVVVALEALRALRIQVLSTATGGARGRRVVVSCEDGSAWVKEL